VTGREAVSLVAGREIRERLRERSFMISTAITLVIVIAVVVLSTVLGGTTRYEVGVADPAAEPVAQAAAAASDSAGFELEIRAVSPGAAAAELEDGSLDAVLTADRIRAEDEPPDELVTVLQAANRQVQAERALEEAGVTGDAAQRALQPPPLAVSTIEPVDDDEDEVAGYTFFVVILLWGQLIGFGYWVAAGVVEEKTSRVVEVVLATIRPAHLLAGKTIGLGLLALGQLLLVAVVGLVAAGVSGALEIDGAILGATLLALAWFVVGYAFYACAFACAGAIVPRQEELQTSLTPLNMLLFAAFFLAFLVRENPDGTLAHVTAFLPITAPITMPPRIVTGDVPALEIAASFGITIAAAAALIPLAARIYAGGVLRTGSALKLREAWRAGRA
jgi:ABC-2 type transport system permease protein